MIPIKKNPHRIPISECLQHKNVKFFAHTRMLNYLFDATKPMPHAHVLRALVKLNDEQVKNLHVQTLHHFDYLNYYRRTPKHINLEQL